MKEMTGIKTMKPMKRIFTCVVVLLISFTLIVPSSFASNANMNITLKGSSQYNNKVVLRWTRTPEAAGYQVFRNGKPLSSLDASLFKSANQGSYRDLHLKRGHRYTYTVRAFKNVDGKTIYGSFSRSVCLKAKYRTPRIVMADRNDPKNRRIKRAFKKIGVKVTIVSKLRQVDPKKYDALIIPGGGDVHPKIWGGKVHPATGPFTPAKDRFQVLAIQKFAKAGKPVMGICRGEQLVNVAFGGTMIQNLYPKAKHATYERGYHKVKMVRGSWVYDVYGSRKKVYFYHHQGVAKLGKGIKATAWSTDHKYKHIEAIEHETLPVYGVQWHPDIHREKQGYKFFREFKKTILKQMAK